MATKNADTIDEPTASTASTAYQEPDPLTDAGRVAGERAGHLADRASDVGFQQADKVTDQAAQPVPNLAVAIAGTTPGTTSDTQTTNDAGCALFEHVPKGTYTSTLTFEAPKGAYSIIMLTGGFDAEDLYAWK